MSVISDAVPHRVEAVAYYSSPYMVRNYSCCITTANCLFAPYLSIYSLVALVSLYRPECNYLSVEYAFPIVTNQNLTECTSMRCTPVRCTFMRYTSMRCTRMRCTPVRYTPLRYTRTRLHASEMH